MAVLSILICLLASCSGNSLDYFDGHSVFISGDDVYVVGSGCTGSSETDRPLLWKNDEQITVGEIGNFNKATSVFVEGSDVYITMSTENGASLWKNGIVQDLSCNDEFSNANSVCVAENKVFVGGKLNDMPVIWVDGKPLVLDNEGCINKIAYHNGKMYVVGYVGNAFGGTPCVWVDGMKEELSVSSGEANDIVFDGDDVYIAGKCYDGAALWKNGQLVMCEGHRSCAYAIAVNNGDVYLGGNGFDESLRPIALLWKNGESRQIEEMRDDIYSLLVHKNKLYVCGSTHKKIPLKIMSL